MILEAGCKMKIETAAVASLVLILRPQSGDGQKVISDYLTFSPDTKIHEFRDAFGNLCQRLMAEPGTMMIESRCLVDAPDEIAVNRNAPFTLVQDLPDDVLQYLSPSRYCQSDLFLKLATRIAEGSSPGYGQAEAIRTWIFRKVKYRYGESNASTSAVETERKRAGVCRDFAHLGISLCRALTIPARMVFGYLLNLDPMDLHAWYEAYVGGKWYTFDATSREPRGNRVIVAYGRDATDVAQMSQYGESKIKEMSVWVRAGNQGSGFPPVTP